MLFFYFFLPPSLTGGAQWFFLTGGAQWLFLTGGAQWFYLFFPFMVMRGMIISSIEMPPCWKVSL